MLYLTYNSQDFNIQSFRRHVKTDLEKSNQVKSMLAKCFSSKADNSQRNGALNPRFI